MPQLIHLDPKELQQHKDKVIKACETYGMKIRIQNTELMLIKRSPKNIDMQSTTIPTVDQDTFKKL